MIRLTKSGPRAPQHPAIRFAHQRDVLTLSRLLAEHRGQQGSRDRFHGLVYAFLIYDHFAAAYKAFRKSTSGIGQSWLDLAVEPNLAGLYGESFHIYEAGGLGEALFNLPILSVSPFH